MAKLALCIGINDYPSTGTDLEGCVNDAMDWQALLNRRGFAVNTLLNAEALGKNIRSAIRNMMGAAGPDDYLVIHYSGHGSFVPDENGDEPDGYDECLCPHDVASKGPITDDELNGLYALRPANTRLVVISDCCYSGTIARYGGDRSIPEAMQSGESHRRSQVRFLPPMSFLPTKVARGLRVNQSIRRAKAKAPSLGLLLAACQDAEKSREDWFQGRANGAFTYTALWALEKLPAKASFRDWFARIRKVLPNQTYPQTPNLFGSQVLKDSVIF